MQTLMYFIIFMLVEDSVRSQSPYCNYEPGVLKLHSCCDIPFTSQINEKCKHEIVQRSQNDTILEAEIARYELTFEMCTAECEFQAKNYLFGINDIDFETVRKDLENNFPQEFIYVNNFIRGMHECLEFARTQAYGYVLEGHASCNYFPGLLRKCAFYAAIRNCTPDRWYNSDECNEIKNWLNECNFAKFL